MVLDLKSLPGADPRSRGVDSGRTAEGSRCPRAHIPAHLQRGRRCARSAGDRGTGSVEALDVLRVLLLFRIMFN